MLLREVNQRIRDVSQSWAEASEPVEFLCECGHAGCSEHLGLPIADYDEMRSVPNRFLLVYGHESAYFSVIARVNGYSVAEGADAGTGHGDTPAAPASAA